jgi:hypothetical protein
MFWNVEARTGLYIFFKTVCDYYGLIPEDNYTIPAEAEGIEPLTDSRAPIPPLILKREPSEPGPEDSDNSSIIGGITDHSLSTAGTTKRHRHSPSVGPTAVSTVVEEAEEEDDNPKTLKQPFTQLFEPTSEDSNAAQSEAPADEAKAEAAEDPAPAPPKADAAEEDSEKQSAGEEAIADPTPLGDEKESEDDENDSDDVDEAETLEVKASTLDADESDESSAESEEAAGVDSSATADTKTAAKTDEPSAEEEKAGN